MTSSRLEVANERITQALENLEGTWMRLVSGAEFESLHTEIFSPIPSNMRILVPLAVVIMFMTIFSAIQIFSNGFTWISFPRKNYEKISDCISKFFSYGLTSTFQLLILFSVGGGVLFQDPENIINSKHAYMENSIGMCIIYFMQIAYYVTQIGFFLLNRQRYGRRAEAIMEFAHHIAALSLIWVSWKCETQRAGLLLLCLLDPCDVILAVAKFFRTCGWNAMGILWFGIFSGVWTYTRIYFYARYFLIMLNVNGKAVRERDGLYYETSAHIAISTLLAVIYLMQLVWSWYIARIWIRVFRTGRLVDLREKDEQGSEEGSHGIVLVDKTDYAKKGARKRTNVPKTGD